MIESMTGYGDAEATCEGVDLIVEIRSVNNRYFKAAVKLPEQLQPFESAVEALLRSRLGRGSVSYALRFSGGDLGPAVIDCRVLAAYVGQLSGLAKPPGIVLDLASLLNLPGVCGAAAVTEDRQQRLWSCVESTTAAALDRLVSMRREEGQALVRDLLGHTAQLRGLAEATVRRAPEVVRDYQRRLKIRVDQLLADASLHLDSDSVLREVAVFADRCDISEELARVGSHLDQFETLSRGQEAAGRKLDFVAQELLREVNTIGSKANDAIITRQVVDMKSCIERIKEQVQNVV